MNFSKSYEAPRIWLILKTSPIRPLNIHQWNFIFLTTRKALNWCFRSNFLWETDFFFAILSNYTILRLYNIVYVYGVLISNNIRELIEDQAYKIFIINEDVTCYIPCFLNFRHPINVIDKSTNYLFISCSFISSSEEIETHQSNGLPFSVCIKLRVYWKILRRKIQKFLSCPF